MRSSHKPSQSFISRYSVVNSFIKYRAGHHEIHGVGAEGQGHLGQDRHQDVGAGRVAGHLGHKGAHQGDDEADHKRVEHIQAGADGEVSQQLREARLLGDVG